MPLIIGLPLRNHIWKLPPPLLLSEIEVIVHRLSDDRLLPLIFKGLAFPQAFDLVFSATLLIYAVVPHPKNSSSVIVGDVWMQQMSQMLTSL